jgi:hypothetical protein
MDGKLTFQHRLSERCGRAEQVAWHISRSGKHQGRQRTLFERRRWPLFRPLPCTALYGTEVWYGGRTRPAKSRSQQIASRQKIDQSKTGMARRADPASHQHLSKGNSARLAHCTKRHPCAATLCFQPPKYYSKKDASSSSHIALRLHCIGEDHPLVSRIEPLTINGGRGPRHPTSGSY